MAGIFGDQGQGTVGRGVVFLRPAGLLRAPATKVEQTQTRAEIGRNDLFDFAKTLFDVVGVALGVDAEMHGEQVLINPGSKRAAKVGLFAGFQGERHGSLEGLAEIAELVNEFLDGFGLESQDPPGFVETLGQVSALVAQGQKPRRIALPKGIRFKKQGNEP